MNNIFFVSDWHFGHQREFIYGPRGFDFFRDHDEAIVQKHNSIVKPNDDVYFLGDAMMGQDHAYGLSHIRRLNGNIHMIRGNHDTDQRWNEYNDLYNVVELCGYGWMGKINGYRFYLTHFPTLTAEWGQKTFKNSLLNICGHSHTKDRWSDADKGMIYHADLDAHDCCPVSLEEVIEDFRKRVLVL